MAVSFDVSKFTTQQVNPTYTDLFTNFVPHPEIHDLVLKRNENSVKQAIYNLIHTYKAERPFQPNLGCNLNRFLFEPISTLTTQNIKDEIASTLGNYEPRIKLQNVEVVPYIDDNLYTVSITFLVINTSTPTTLNTILYRVR